MTVQKVVNGRGFDCRNLLCCSSFMYTSHCCKKPEPEAEAFALANFNLMYPVTVSLIDENRTCIYLYIRNFLHQTRYVVRIKQRMFHTV